LTTQVGGSEGSLLWILALPRAMPELPEVEHVVRALAKALTGRRFIKAELRLQRIAPGISRREFNRKLQGSLIETVTRRGKFILIKLDSGRILIVHLRMTGKFVRLTLDQKLPPYSHVVFYLDDDHRLVYCDMRQFGRMQIVSSTSLGTTPGIAALAPEPLQDQFSPDYLRQTLARSRRSVKTLLLDQTRVLGLGNIYATEALFTARISPFAIAATLSKARSLRLYRAIRDTLQEAIESGSTLRIDLDDGDGGYFGSLERFWHVYERAGEPCVRCGAGIRRAVQAGRSTYFCPRCQRS
jgi:formamidopyrimidine-DNA glycosylase